MPKTICTKVEQHAPHLKKLSMKKHGWRYTMRFVNKKFIHNTYSNDIYMITNAINTFK